MRIVFAGTPQFAVAPLGALAAAGYEIAAVLTQPDRPQGRRGVLTPSPVKVRAAELGIPVLQPARIRDDFAPLAAVRADLMVTCAYGQILSREVLDLFPLGVWNVHASLLPAYRGAAPVAAAIIGGERETGVTVMRTEEGLDTGDILLSARCPVGDGDTCGTLTEKLSSLGASLIVEALGLVGSGNAAPVKQGEGFVCKKVGHTQVDFSLPACAVSRLVRGLSPAPLAYGTAGGLSLNFFFAEEVPCEADVPAGTVVCCSPKRGLVVKCGQGAVRLTEVQPAGGKRMRDTDFCNGRKIAEGARFDQPVL